jgi:ribosomal protein L16 Arg81 hydroxylase
MSEKRKQRDSGGRKLLASLLPGGGGGNSDYSDSLEEERSAGGSRKVANDEIRALRDAIEQQRLQMEQMSRACTSVAAQQAGLHKIVMQHLTYEQRRDDEQAKQEAEEDVRCCGLSLAKLF